MAEVEEGLQGHVLRGTGNEVDLVFGMHMRYRQRVASLGIPDIIRGCLMVDEFGD